MESRYLPETPPLRDEVFEREKARIAHELLRDVSGNNSELTDDALIAAISELEKPTYRTYQTVSVTRLILKSVQEGAVQETTEESRQVSLPYIGKEIFGKIVLAALSNRPALASRYLQRVEIIDADFVREYLVKIAEIKNTRQSLSTPEKINIDKITTSVLTAYLKDCLYKDRAQVIKLIKQQTSQAFLNNVKLRQFLNECKKEVIATRDLSLLAQIHEFFDDKEFNLNFLENCLQGVLRLDNRDIQEFKAIIDMAKPLLPEEECVAFYNKAEKKFLIVASLNDLKTAIEGNVIISDEEIAKEQADYLARNALEQDIHANGKINYLRAMSEKDVKKVISEYKECVNLCLKLVDLTEEWGGKMESIKDYALINMAINKLHIIKEESNDNAYKKLTDMLRVVHELMNGLTNNHANRKEGVGKFLKIFAKENVGNYISPVLTELNKQLDALGIKVGPATGKVTEKKAEYYHKVFAKFAANLPKASAVAEASAGEKEMDEILDKPASSTLGKRRNSKSS